MMDLLKDFKNPESMKGFAREIERLSRKYSLQANFMEVCGGHTHVIARYSLEQLLPPEIRFIHGPGCPVCILPKGRVDHAVILSERKDTIVVTVGDMIRVPGTEKSLEKARSEGRDIRTVYSPLEALEIAKSSTEKKVIYFAIGFETTTPSTALIIEKTIQSGLKNLFFYTNHVLVPPVLEAILSDSTHKIGGFIAPSHVSVITGSEVYRPLCEKHGLPVVVAGFESGDIMQAVYMLVKQLAEKRCELEVQYDRCVTENGNIKSQDLVSRYFVLEESFEWRGPGFIEKSSLRLRDEYDFLNAAVVFREYLPEIHTDDHRLCLCSEILKGKKRPADCRVFRTRCTPDNPLGACMVSGEGACAAYYKYGRTG
ncbi:MAG: hydrogenase formation protein HypD [Spirochaetia bacterium]|nr:hydrogenase formation protein HypD [Spirochaetia bacterium]